MTNARADLAFALLADGGWGRTRPQIGAGGVRGRTRRGKAPQGTARRSSGDTYQAAPYLPTASSKQILEAAVNGVAFN